MGWDRSIDKKIMQRFFPYILSSIGFVVEYLNSFAVWTSFSKLSNFRKLSSNFDRTKSIPNRIGGSEKSRFHSLWIVYPDLLHNRRFHLQKTALLR